MSFNIGVISPIIFIQQGYTPDEENLVYYHESKHIQHLDCFLRFLGFIVIAIHWINPLSYLLLRELIKQSEFSVDESIMKKMSRGEKEEYGNLILKNLTSQPVNVKEKYVSSLKGTHFITAKERIMRMKNIRNNKTIKKGIVLAASLIAISINIIPVMAYQKPRLYIDKDTESSIFLDPALSNSDMAFFSEGEPGFLVDENLKPDFSESNQIFIDEESQTIIPLTPYRRAIGSK